MVKRIAFTREERKLMIVQFMLVVTERQGCPAQVTLAEIAHALKMTPQQKMRDMLIEMEIEGQVKSSRHPYPGVCGFRRIYSLVNENTLAALKIAKDAARGQKRSIPINTAQGVLWGEL